MNPQADPIRLLRDPAPVEAYSIEPSDEALAERLGMDPSAVTRFDMNTMPLTPWSEYNDQAYVRLRAALGRAAGVEPGRVVPGAGADELIRLVTSQVIGPGDAVVVPVPTFAMFAVEGRIAGGRVVSVARSHPARRQPIEELREATEREGARLVWLCSPNNPTGDRYELDEIADLADRLEAIVVVDEVYLEFAEAELGAEPNALSAASLQDRLPNVVVLRSLSKAYGLAAARVGYLVVADPLAARFDAVRLPLAISGPGERLALEVLADAHRARAMRAEVLGQRRAIAAALERLGYEVLPSVANFVAFRPPDATALADALDARGLVLRRYDAGPMRGWLRVTARPAAETSRLLAALEVIEGAGA